ncbi:MAG TPA: FecR domain-containing protein [Pyrinomonadaceae bacterium]|nr:FecR domain-containing protein [Pyrinomonadaceae bacterium]
MKRNRKELDAILDKVVDGVRDEPVEQSAVNTAASRVWARVSGQAAGEKLIDSPATAAAAERIGGCADYQSLIPSYLRGELSPARALLLEDHTHECIPCRKALKAARTGAPQVAARATQVKPATTRQTSFAPAWRWSIAAGLLLCFGLAAMFYVERLDLSGKTLAATVESADGDLYRVSETESRALRTGEQIQKGERVRTSKASNAVLRLADGSLVEMRERSEVSVTENMKGVTVKLERGDVAVEAAKQRERHLYVATPDSLVSVTGTIFFVGSGTKGSRVSVVEGEVHVNHAGKDDVLHPGDQVTTNARLEPVSLTQEVAWSRNAARYTQLAAELTRLRQDINARVPRPGVRYSSRFLDLVPEGTILYAALPNLSQRLADSHRIMQERINQNPALKEWWKNEGREGRGAGADQIIERVREFGAHLGDEIVVSAGLDAKNEPGNILVLGELKNAADFRPYLEGQIARFAREGKDSPAIRIVDDPLAAATQSSGVAGKDEIFVWVRNDLFAASPQIENLRQLSTTLDNTGANRFVGTSFHARLAEIYREGAGLVVAADLEKLVGQVAREDGNLPGGAGRVEGFRQLGLTSLKHLVVEQKDLNEKTQSRAVLTFSEPRRGIASWLAAPGAMGALEFVSPDANVATAFVVKEPALLVDDLLGFLETVQPDLRRQLREIEAQQGIDIRRDLAAPLGGEFAFAIDGPLLPTPSWKMILEVNDQAHLQGSLERVVERLNGWAKLSGKGGLRWENTTEGGRTIYTLRSADFGLEVHYTFVNGYLVVTPSRALLGRALQYRESGNTLLRSARFRETMPEDGNANFSAILYHDFAPALRLLAERAPESQRGTLAAAAEMPPTLAYAYAQGDRITLAANTEGGPFGLSPDSLIGLPNSLAMQNILMNAMSEKNERKR